MKDENLVRNRIDFNRNVFFARNPLCFWMFGDGVPVSNSGRVQEEGVDDVLEVNQEMEKFCQKHGKRISSTKKPRIFVPILIQWWQCQKKFLPALESKAKITTT